MVVYMYTYEGKRNRCIANVHHITSTTPSLYTEVSVPTQENEESCTWV